MSHDDDYDPDRKYIRDSVEAIVRASPPPPELAATASRVYLETEAARRVFKQMEAAELKTKEEKELADKAPANLPTSPTVN